MIAALARRLPFFYGWVIVAVAFLTMAVGVNAFGWNRGITAGAFSFGFLVSALLSPIIGRLMDRKGPVWVMEIGAVGLALGMSLATLMREPWHLYATLGVLVGGSSVATGYSAQGLYLPSWFVRNRALALSIAFAGVGAGSIVLLPVMSHMIATVGWRQACLGLAVVSVVLVVPINLLVRRRPQDIGLTPDGESEAAALAGRRVTIVDPEWAATDWTLGRAMRTARFWWLVLGMTCAMFSWYAVQVHQTKFLLDVGFSAEVAGWALGFVSLAGIPGQIVLGGLSDRIGREPIWTLGCLGFVITYALLIALTYWPSPILLWGRHFGTIFSTMMLSGIAGGAAGPFVVGVLHDRLGSDIPGYIIAGCISVVSAIAIWIAAPRKVRRVGGGAPRLGKTRKMTGS
ncbi:MAG: MFS transporter [Alphaproteobacteria bacterium]|nr:MFS transporter [Alphaproteobacteria bacterium]